MRSQKRNIHRQLLLSVLLYISINFLYHGVYAVVAFMCFYAIQLYVYLCCICCEINYIYNSHDKIFPTTDCCYLT